jgi:hypothetical protein
LHSKQIFIKTDRINLANTDENTEVSVMNTALAGLVILMIGDSHMMSMLTTLHDQLEDNGAVVHSYAMCGATASDWLSPTIVSCGRGEHHEHAAPVIQEQKMLPTYVLNDLIQKSHPNLIIVELGDTLAAYGSPMATSWVHDEIHGLMGKIAASKISCVWVGPIWGLENSAYHKTVAGVQEVSHLLSQSVAPCSYIESIAFARPGEWPTRDGTHLQPDGYRKWARAITDAIVRMKGQGVLSAR